MVEAGGATPEPLGRGKPAEGVVLEEVVALLLLLMLPLLLGVATLVASGLGTVTVVNLVVVSRVVEVDEGTSSATPGGVDWLLLLLAEGVAVAVAVALVAGVGSSVTGQTVVPMTTISVVTLPGQSAVTVGAQLVMVYVLVE